MALTQDEWRRKRADMVDAMEAIMNSADEEERALTNEEQARFDDYADQIKQNDDKMKRLAKLEAVNQPLDLPKPARPKPGEELEDRRQITVPATARRHGELRAFRGAQAAENAYACGKWMQAGWFGHTDEGQRARKFCRNRGLEFRVMTESSGTAGGYLVPEAMENAIIALREERGVARRECQMVTMPAETLLHPRRTSGITVYAIGETDSITASDAAVDQVQLVARKFGAMTRFSTDLNEDTLISFTDFLTEEIAYGFADKEDECLFNGDGTNTYHGIFGIMPKATDGNHAGTVCDATSGIDTWAEVTAADLNRMVAQLPQYASANAKWFIHRQGFYLSMQRLMDALGGNTIDILAAGGTTTGGRPVQYQGFPVAISQVISTTESNNEAVIAFGDMKQTAMFGDRRGITLKIDGSRYLEYDQMAIQATERFDIVCSELGDSSTAGSMIVYTFNT